MPQLPFNELQMTALTILNEYCNKYILFKPIHYLLANKYIDKLHKIVGEDVTKGVQVLNVIFDVYKKLVENKSEVLATSIGSLLAQQLNVSESDFLKYRESKIWTQRYIQGFGLFESQVYEQKNKKPVPHIAIDPVYNAYVCLNNLFKLSKVITEDMARCNP